MLVSNGWRHNSALEGEHLKDEMDRKKREGDVKDDHVRPQHG